MKNKRPPQRVTGIRTDHLKKSKSANKKSATQPPPPSGAPKVGPTPVRRPQQSSSIDAPAPTGGPRTTRRPSPTSRAEGSKPGRRDVRKTAAPRRRVSLTAKTWGVIALLSIAGVLFVGYQTTEFLGDSALLDRTEKSHNVSVVRGFLESQQDLDELDMVIADVLDSGTSVSLDGVVSRYQVVASRYEEWEGDADFLPGAQLMNAHATAGADLARTLNELYLRGLPIGQNINAELINLWGASRQEQVRQLEIYIGRYGLSDLAKEYQ